VAVQDRKRPRRRPLEHRYAWPLWAWERSQALDRLKRQEERQRQVPEKAS
jgi:hypothetical protein